jgi:hypothetical protein
MEFPGTKYKLLFRQPPVFDMPRWSSVITSTVPIQRPFFIVHGKYVYIMHQYMRSVHNRGVLVIMLHGDPPVTGKGVGIYLDIKVRTTARKGSNPPAGHILKDVYRNSG